ncbi:MAG: HEAT repeat domain-containing protein [Cyanobacteria bacterium P01_A01_bin.80]
MIMEVHQIKDLLDSSDPQKRMKGMVELRKHPPEVVVPLLKQRMYDKEFMIRSFAAMGLGNKRNDEAFQALLDLLDYESDYNVKAEIANALAKYGDRAIPYVMKIFQQETHWLIRKSIFAALEGTSNPEVILQLCRWGIEDDDMMVKQTAFEDLGRLSKTESSETALEILLAKAVSEDSLVRAEVVKALRNFDDKSAKVALDKLRQDSDYKVIGATLEGLL